MLIELVRALPNASLIDMSTEAVHEVLRCSQDDGQAFEGARTARDSSVASALPT
jgi:hypothetical protein